MLEDDNTMLYILFMILILGTEFLLVLFNF